MNEMPFGIPRELPVWVEAFEVVGARGPMFLVDPTGIFDDQQTDRKKAKSLVGIFNQTRIFPSRSFLIAFLVLRSTRGNPGSYFLARVTARKRSGG